MLQVEEVSKQILSKKDSSSIQIGGDLTGTDLKNQLEHKFLKREFHIPSVEHPIVAGS